MKINGKTVEPAKAVMTPYAMALMSEDLFQASENYKPERFRLINYFLYAASIEMGLKSAILSIDCSKTNKEKIKKFGRNGHDLIKAIECFEKEVQPDLFSVAEKKLISELNNHYQTKGIEYFTLPVLVSSLKGFKDFPDIKKIQAIAQRVNAYLILNKYFIQSTTSDKSGKGLINFY